MVTRTQISFVAVGQAFRPSTVEAAFSEREDPGEMGKRGRYRGVPVPVGSATFCVPESEGIRYLHETVAPLLPALRAAGATEFFIHITYHHDGQCALGFTAEEMRMLADLGCEVSVDCWREDEEGADAG